MKLRTLSVMEKRLKYRVENQLNLIDTSREFLYHDKIYDIDEFLEEYTTTLTKIVNELRYTPLAPVTALPIYDGAVHIFLVRDVNKFIDLLILTLVKLCDIKTTKADTKAYYYYLLCYSEVFATTFVREYKNMITFDNFIIYYPYMSTNVLTQEDRVRAVILNAVVSVIKMRKELFDNEAYKIYPLSNV